MKRGELGMLDGWHEYLRSDGFRRLSDGICRGLEPALGGLPSLGARAAGVMSWQEVSGRSAAHPLAFLLRLPDGGSAVATTSAQLPSFVLRNLATDKLMLYRSFRRAAFELVLLETVRAVAAGGGPGILVVHADQTGPLPPESSGSRFLHVSVGLDLPGASGVADIYFPLRRAPAAILCPEREFSAQCSECVVLDNVTAASLRRLCPGDEIATPPHTGDGARFLLARLTSDRWLELPVEPAPEGPAGMLLVTDTPTEVSMPEATVSERADAGRPLFPEGMALPARLELCTFSLPFSRLSSLSGGSVIDPGIEPGSPVRLFVCGALFAEGRMVRHEDFSGFHIDRIY